MLLREPETIMAERNGKMPFLLEDLQALLKDEDSYLIRDFEEVAKNFVEGYSRFVSLGIPGSTIGLAMLGATINLYSMFGMRDELPNLFRSLADKLENDEPFH